MPVPKASFDSKEKNKEEIYLTGMALAALGLLGIGEDRSNIQKNHEETNVERHDMINNNTIWAAGAVLLLMAGCTETTGGGSAIPAGNSAEEAARQACLSAVRAETNNPQVAVGSSEFSEAGTRVIVAVGPQQAAWECIAYRDGSTTRPVSLTNEGAL